MRKKESDKERETRVTVILFILNLSGYLRGRYSKPGGAWSRNHQSRRESTCTIYIVSLSG